MKIISVFFILIILASCKKYDEGPALSFKSKKERVCNTWRIEQAFEGDVDKSTDYQDWRLTLTKEDYYHFYTIGTSSISLNFTGRWEFDNNKKNIIARATDGSGEVEYVTYEILRLMRNEMWLFVEASNLEWRLVPA
ncbi:MAG: hypothetical protein ACK4ND_01540 [Cytophagaceae bacterium]